MNAPLHILVVEDQSDVAEVMRDILNAAGYRVSVAKNGAAMRAALRSGDPVDAAVLDAMIPDESCASLARCLKEGRVPVLLCSGSVAASVIAHKELLPLLAKPFRGHELRDALSKVLTNGKRHD